jgi:hypothetical protein
MTVRKAAHLFCMAWERCPSGVEDQGMSASGSPRNLGDPATSSDGGRGERGNGLFLMDGRESEHLHSTEEAGEPIPRDPVEGRRVSEHGSSGGKGGWELRVPATSQRNSKG